MARKPSAHETGMDRLKKIKLWQWGLIVIFASVISNLIMQLTPLEGSSSQKKAIMLGRAIAALLGIFIGSAMIVVHLVRSRKR